jgi:hypothetical protein
MFSLIPLIVLEIKHGCSLWSRDQLFEDISL